MYSVVVVLGMVLHVIHSTKGRVHVISTSKQVNNFFTQRKTIFGNVFDTTILHFTR